MRIFRKRKKFGNFRGSPEDAEPLPDIVYQMGAESAAKYAALRSMSPGPYGGIDPSGQEAIFGYPQIYMAEEDNFDERARASSPFGFMASPFGFGRSKSRERRAHRPMDRFVELGSPVHFRELPPGTPVKFRRRPASPELMQARASSPYHFAREERVPSPLHFAQQKRSGSPDVIRRLQRAQLSQDLQRIERQQKRQHEMMQINAGQYIPEQHQPYYPLGNPHGYMQDYYSMQQPQMYSYY